MVKAEPLFVTVDTVLALIKSVRAGTATVASLSLALQQLDQTQMIIVADLARIKMDMLKTIRDMKPLI